MVVPAVTPSIVINSTMELISKRSLPISTQISMKIKLSNSARQHSDMFLLL